MNAREMRNTITHDDLNDFELLAEYFNRFIESARELLGFWVQFKKKIQALV